jgi:hypothetical protein
MSNTQSYIARPSTWQENRFFRALAKDYVQIDERSPEDFVLFTVNFSKLINFYNLENEIDGDWSDFLTDEIVLLAIIQNEKPHEREARFKEAIDKAQRFIRAEKQAQYFQKAIREIYGMAFTLNDWLNQFKAIEQFANIQLAIRDEILSIIEVRLADALQQVSEIAQREQIDLRFEEFDRIWGDLHTFSLEEGIAPENPLESENSFSNIREKDEGLFIRHKGESGGEASRLQRLGNIEALKGIFQTFYETLLYLKNQSAAYWDKSLLSDNHYPEIALFLSFLKLFRHSQTHLNGLSAKYLDFYYRTVLQQQPKSPVHDQVYLTFTPTETTLFADIAQGQAFVGGEYANGENILYLADHPLRVIKAKLQKLKTVFLDYRMLNIRGVEKKLVTNLFSAEVPVADVTPNPQKTLQRSFPTFGESQGEKGAREKTMHDAAIGFAIASPSLFLSEGKREITLTLQFSEESFQSLTRYLQDLSHATGDKVEEVFIKAFLDAFQLAITTPTGWHTMPKYVVTKSGKAAESAKDCLLEIKFNLESNEPPATAYQPQVHQGQFRTNLPVLKIVLNNQSYIFPYSLLQNLVLEQVRIRTQVSGVKDLKLYSQIGELNPGSPFFPFGSLPGVGSYLIIGKNEIFQKSLDDLHINIEWFNLPTDKYGFFGYYKDYGLGIDNTSFEVNLSILDSGRWKPEKSEERQPFKLFRSNGASEKGATLPSTSLSSETNLENIDIVRLRLPANYKAISETQEYNNITQRGFIKLELTKPDFAFANTVYPSVLSEIVMDNSKTSYLPQVTKKEPKPLPNPPFVPQIKSISLDYVSTSVISLQDRSQKGDKASRGQFFHLYPFGEKLIYPDNSQQITTLIPELNYEGALLVGLSDLNPPQTLSLLFEMAAGFSLTSEEEPPTVEWSYLAGDEWKPIAESKILKDQTNKFLKTGIVEIELPDDMRKGNTILDPNFFWLRIAVTKHVGRVAQTLSLSTNALTATLQNLDEAGIHLEKSLPAFTITRSVTNIVGVQAIKQPLASFGGKSAESEGQFYLRVSERLRHRQRAVTPWDFERLVLEKFSTIAKVTCLPNMTSQRLQAPGSVLLVVTPYPPNQQTTLNLEPKVGAEVLRQIKDYLQNYTSSLVRLEVRNPSYEKVRIICAVKLASGYNYGFYLQKLNEEINRYLLKDRLNTYNSLELGGKINSSDILSFMRTLPYIEFITKFSMIQIATDYTGKYILLDTAREEGAGKSFLQATKPWSCLIPAGEHQITLLDAKEEIKSAQAGIESLELGGDFVIEE